MSIEFRIQHLEEQLQDRLENRARLMESFVDAPGAMQSWSDKSREHLAKEIEIVDKSIQHLNSVIDQLRTLAPQDSDVIQIGHVVDLQIEDDEPEKFLLLEDLGGIAAGDLMTLSTGSQIGQAILGKRVNEYVSAKVPQGVLNIQILSVE